MSEFNLPLPVMVVQVIAMVCIAYAIKAVVDARVRTRLIAANLSDDVVRALLADDRRRRQHALLRWGVILLCLAGGFGLIEVLGWRDVTPGAIATLLGATGLGSLFSYAIGSRFSQEPPHAGNRKYGG